jgi:hypothetical protein
LIQDEINRRLNSGNACYHSVQNLLSSRLLSKNITIGIYETINLPVVLYGCETWSLTLREEGAEENIWTKEDEGTGGCRKLHNEELHNLCSSPSIIKMTNSRRMRWVGGAAGMGSMGMHIGYWWENEKRPLGRPRRRWVDNIKVVIRDIGWGGMDWIDLAFVNTVMNLRVP